jgi:hypothetical protein
MAQMILDTGHREESVRRRFGAKLNLLSEMLNAFVSYRIRLAAAEAEHVCPRQTAKAPSPSTNAR